MIQAQIGLKLLYCIWAEDLEFLLGSMTSIKMTWVLLWRCPDPWLPLLLHAALCPETHEGATDTPYVLISMFYDVYRSTPFFQLRTGSVLRILSRLQAPGGDNPFVLH